MYSDPTNPDTMPHEYVDAEISVAGLETPSDEQALHSALDGLDGIKTLRISRGLVAVEYDPLQITKARLSEAITRAGFRVAEVESGLASPISDALLHPESDET
jgi:copper chaperone CopZ